MTSPITAKTCEAWFLLEAADMRGLPAPFVVRIYEWDDRTVELQMRDDEEVTIWAESLGTAVDERLDGAGFTHWTTEGELHDMSVKVTAAARVPAVAK